MLKLLERYRTVASRPRGWASALLCGWVFSQVAERIALAAQDSMRVHELYGWGLSVVLAALLFSMVYATAVILISPFRPSRALASAASSAVVVGVASAVGANAWVLATYMGAGIWVIIAAGVTGWVVIATLLDFAPCYVLLGATPPAAIRLAVRSSSLAAMLGSGVWRWLSAAGSVGLAYLIVETMAVDAHLSPFRISAASAVIVYVNAATAAALFLRAEEERDDFRAIARTFE